MAGIFGDEINSRADFFRLLGDARRLVAKILARRRNDTTLGSVQTQLEAIEQWTGNGRTPTPDERGRIGMGLRMSREMADESDPEIQELTRLATVLNNYFEYWPDDAAAQDPDNDYLLFQ
jgi:hypothetical protein